MTLYLVWTPQYPWEKHLAEAFGASTLRETEELAMRAIRKRYPKALTIERNYVSWPDAAQHCQGWEGKPVEMKVVFAGPYQGSVALLVRLAVV